MLSEKFKKIFEVCLMAQDMVDLGGCSWTLEKNVCNYTPSWYWKAWFVLSLVRFLIFSKRSVCNPPSLHCSLCYTEAASSCWNLDSFCPPVSLSCTPFLSACIPAHQSKPNSAWCGVLHSISCPLHSTLVLTLLIGMSPLLGCLLLFPLMRLWYPTPSYLFAVSSSLPFSGSDLQMLVLSIVWRPSPSP